MEASIQFAHADDDARIAWHAIGAGEPLLLISGQAVDSRSWEPIVPVLSERHRVITFDHRGTGRSDIGVDDSYSTRSFARDALAVLDDAGVTQAHIYGHSMGGRVAQWIAIDHTPRVAFLVLGATTAGDARGVRRTLQATADLASGDPDRLARLFFHDGKRRSDAAAFFDQTATPHTKKLHLAASRAHDAWDRLAEITAPTLVIHGTDDEMTPPGNAERIAALIVNAELALCRGARHGYYLDDPGATDLVLAFLQRHPIG